MSNYNAVAAKNVEQAPKNLGHYSQSVAFSHYNNLSAQLPIDPKTGQLVSDCVEQQAIQCFENIKAVVEGVDHVMTDVVRITIMVTNIKDLDKVDQVYKSYFPTYLPTQTKVAVDALPCGAKVQVEALLSHGEGTIPNAPQSGDLIKLYNNTCNAPLSNLSNQTVAFSHYNNITAQVAIDPKTGRVIDGDVQAQTAQCLKNIKAILESIDVPLDDIVKINLYLKDLKDMDQVEGVYRRFFPDSGIARAVGYMPALTSVEVKALPMDALVQVEAVVSHGDGTPPQLVEDRHGIIIEANNTDKAPVSDLSSQTVAFSHYNHLSGQLPLDLETGKMVEGIKAQTSQCLDHIKAIVESVDHSMDQVVKVNIFLKDLSQMDLVNEVYATYFPQNPPARKIVGVANLEGEALIKIDAVVSNEEGTPPLK